ncbi:MAG: spondin domain-containing protein [Candidatus Thiodiazotropha sp. (ex Cardiolucina cf. quadrata)]|nr:spondin domain-containing protein [Candidatus Thiodiazotropha sp. (ex Cardiolucina cf. quadrata)]
MRNKLTMLALAGAFAATPTLAQDLTISITNLTHGSYFTPLLVAAHAGGNHIFQLGTTASTNLQAMAEGGDISGLSADMAAVNADSVENPAGGLLAPGATTTFDLTHSATNDHLSLTAMILPTNDGFVGVDSLSIPTAAGTYRYQLNAYDAGTEANDEIINGGGAPGVAGVPADPGGQNGTGATGVTTAETNAHVHIHRGVLGDSDESAGVSDLNSSVHRWLNPVAQLVITVN